MGLTGTDVTKEASDIVLTDDNFATIVKAVEEGRGVFDNIQKVVIYLLSTNASEVLFMFFAAIAGWPIPLTPLQILWINLVTDGLPAIALGLERPDRGLMRRKPRSTRDPVISWRTALVVGSAGVLIALVVGAAYWLTYQGIDDRLPLARTVAFFLISFSQLLYAVSCRSQSRTMPELGLFSNPYVLGAILVSVILQVGVLAGSSTKTLFNVVDLSFQQVITIAALALLPVTVIEMAKLIRLRRRPHFSK
jgi:Ca2+-transporting ATPase